jgi:hypothetical protein
MKDHKPKFTSQIIALLHLIWDHRKWAPIPFAIAADQLWSIPGVFWVCLASVAICLIRHQHLERMEDKRLAHEAREAAFDRAFQRDMIPKLLSHALKTNQPIVFPINQGKGPLLIGRTASGTKSRASKAMGPAASCADRRAREANSNAGLEIG